jgi:hypothetical protein
MLRKHAPIAEKHSWLKTGPSAGASGTVAIATLPNLANQIPAGSLTYIAERNCHRGSIS